MKKCPYCAEEIMDEAIKCRYCGSELVSRRKEIGKSALALALTVLVLPGSGHLVLGRKTAGILLMLGSILLAIYTFFSVISWYWTYLETSLSIDAMASRGALEIPPFPFIPIVLLVLVYVGATVDVLRIAATDISKAG